MSLMGGLYINTNSLAFGFMSVDSVSHCDQKYVFSLELEIFQNEEKCIWHVLIDHSTSFLIGLMILVTLSNLSTFKVRLTQFGFVWISRESCCLVSYKKHLLNSIGPCCVPLYKIPSRKSASQTYCGQSMTTSRY